MNPRPPRLRLAHLPTPLERHASLDALVGTELWVKRDDMSAGPEAGNKIRKLEFLLAEALEQNRRVVITCGGLQSNHARATALLCARLGLRCVLLLRTASAPDSAPEGNWLLDRLAGAEIRFITPDQYRVRDELMAQLAAELESRGEPAYVVPEGGSNALGALGYVEAMRELREQLDRAGPRDGFGAVVVACGSGGTLAGVSLGAARYGVAPLVIGMAVCDDRTYFEHVASELIRAARRFDADRVEPAALRVEDAFKGPAYAVSTAEQRRFMVQVARASGLVLDPVYTGKALFGLSRLADKPQRVLFIHTGGLPGLLASPREFAAELD